MQFQTIKANITIIMEMKRINKIMIDIHAHIIPGIDDGAENIDVALKMLKNAEKDGTKKIVATPHYCRGYGEATINEIKVFIEKLNKKVQEENINIEIYSGQEVYFSEHMIEDYKNGIIGTINDSKYMLIEFPMDKFDSNIFDVIYEIQLMGVKVIIAHPERYLSIVENPSFINRFIEEGYLFQVNAGSIEGKFGKKIKKTAELLITNRIYSFIGSDAHNEKSRPTGLSEALKIANKFSFKTEGMFMNNSVKIINNQDVVFYGDKIKVKKSIFSFLARNK